jgi:hypothetical protein
VVGVPGQVRERGGSPVKELIPVPAPPAPDAEVDDPAIWI